MMEQLQIKQLRSGPSGNPTAPNAANTDETKANPYPKLPEVLTLSTGEVVTTPKQWWEQRRPEIVKAFEQEVYGHVHENVPKVKWKVEQTRQSKAGDIETIEKQIVGVVDNSACPEIEVRISMSLTLPRNAVKPVPVLMMFGPTPFDPPPPWLRKKSGDAARSRPEDKFIEAGWGYAKLNPSSVQDDSGGFRSFDPNAEKRGMGLTRGIIGLMNCGQPRKPEQWGSLRAWAWGASRGLDYLATEPMVDKNKIGIEGVSRFGKAALVTMAFDQRFAMVLIGSSGKGGTTLLRRNYGEAVETLASSGEYHWMAGNFLKYAAADGLNPGDLPVDSHQLIALCAPRLTFISYGIPEKGDAHWLDQRGSFMAAIAAQPVFRLLGVKALGRSDNYSTEPMPPVKQGLLEGKLAWRQHDGGHTDAPNYETFIRWAESNFESKDDQSSNVDQRSLKQAAGDRFKMGVGIGNEVFNSQADVKLLKQQFDIITPENCMKPQELHPSEEIYRFTEPDKFAAFARTNNLEVVGHCLVWAKDDRTDAWMLKEKDSTPVTKETLLKRIESHINTVVGRYGDVATMWDVVNEALADGNDEFLRDSVYTRTTGIDFIVSAFKTARAKDPTALLIYNDYNCHKPEKRKKLIKLLKMLKEKGAPVDAYGMQGHFELGDNSVEDLRATFKELRGLGIKVVVSELDIDVVKRGEWWADGGKYREKMARYDPYRDYLPQEILQQQAEQYAALFQLFKENSDIIARVSFWNLHDGQSWLNYFPWDRVNHPLLFDRNRRPKPAFDAVYKVLQE